MGSEISIRILVVRKQSTCTTDVGMKDENSQKRSLTAAMLPIQMHGRARLATKSTLRTVGIERTDEHGNGRTTQVRPRSRECGLLLAGL